MKIDPHPGSAEPRTEQRLAELFRQPPLDVEPPDQGFWVDPTTGQLNLKVRGVVYSYAPIVVRSP